MSEDDPIELEVRLSVTEESLTGEVTGIGQPPVRFSGWLGLLGAVEQACELAGSPRADVPAEPVTGARAGPTESAAGPG